MIFYKYFHRISLLFSFITFCSIISIQCLQSSETLTSNFGEFIDENDFENILHTFNHRFVSIKSCYVSNDNLFFDSDYCRCFTNSSEILRLCSVRVDANQSLISFDRFSVVVLTHVLHSRVGLVCKVAKTTTGDRLTNKCIDSYEEYVSQLSRFVALDKSANESNLFSVIDPFVRQSLQYYVANNTDQCFTAEELVKEYQRFGDLQVSDHELHQLHDNSSHFTDIEFMAQMIVRRLINGECVKYGETDYLDYLLAHYGTGGDLTIGERGFERLLRDLSLGNTNSLAESHTQSDDGHEDGHNQHNHEHQHQRELDDHHHDGDHDHHTHNHVNHTHKHHKRSVPMQTNNITEQKLVCLNDNYYLSTFTSDGHLTGEQMKNLCPVLLQQIVSRVCTEGQLSSKEHNHLNPNLRAKEGPLRAKSTTSKLTNAELYGYSSLAVFIISLTAILGIFILPLLSKSSYNYVMVCFIGLAFGTLAGDALLHLIPHALGIHSHDDSDGDHGHDHRHEQTPDLKPQIPDYFWLQLCLLLSIYGLFLFELIINAIYSDDESDNHSHSGHSHSIRPDFNRNTTSVPTLQSNDSTTSYSNSLATFDTNSVGTVKSTENLTPDKVRGNEVILEGNSVIWGMTPLALIITIGDAIHNFADGLAIGVAFSSGFASGISTSVAVLCHEIPHELGDFAVLLSTGLSVKKAAIINFVSGLTAFAGLYIGIVLGTNTSAQQWILAICAGIFLYVALTDMLPELKQKSKSSHPFVLLLMKNFGVLLGIGFMAIIAIYEDQLHFD